MPAMKMLYGSRRYVVGRQAQCRYRKKPGRGRGRVDVRGKPSSLCNGGNGVCTVRTTMYSVAESEVTQILSLTNM